jgi:hypothetical protein
VLKQNQAVLHIGTSSQVAFLSNQKPEIDVYLNYLLRYPYFNGKCLVVAASLNGGNVFELLIRVEIIDLSKQIHLENRSILF